MSPERRGAASTRLAVAHATPRRPHPCAGAPPSQRFRRVGGSAGSSYSGTRLERSLRNVHFRRRQRSIRDARDGPPARGPRAHSAGRPILIVGHARPLRLSRQHLPEPGRGADLRYPHLGSRRARRSRSPLSWHSADPGGRAVTGWDVRWAAPSSPAPPPTPAVTAAPSAARPNPRNSGGSSQHRSSLPPRKPVSERRQVYAINPRSGMSGARPLEKGAGRWWCGQSAAVPCAMPVNRRSPTPIGSGPPRLRFAVRRTSCLEGWGMDSTPRGAVGPRRPARRPPVGQGSLVGGLYGG